MASDIESREVVIIELKSQTINEASVKQLRRYLDSVREEKPELCQGKSGVVGILCAYRIAPGGLKAAAASKDVEVFGFKEHNIFV